MTNEKMYTLICKIIDSPMESHMLDLIRAKEELEEDMRVAECKKTRSSKAVSVLKRMMRYTNGWRNEYMEYGDRFCFTDGYRLAVLNSDFGYKKTSTPFANIDQFLDEPRTYSIEVDVDVADLKAFLLREKANGRGVKLPFNSYNIRTADFEIRFNPSYLMDWIDLMGTSKLYVAHPYKPAYMKNEAGEEAILLPCRHLI